MEQRGRRGAGDQATHLPGRDRVTGIGGAAPAGGARHPALGRQRAPPAGITTRCQELADGGPSRSARGSKGKAHPKGGGVQEPEAGQDEMPKARPGAVRRTPQIARMRCPGGAPRGARTLPATVRALLRLRFIGAPSPRLLRGTDLSAEARRAKAEESLRPSRGRKEHGR